MFIAVGLQRANNQPSKQSEQVVLSTFGDTAEDAASSAERQIDAYRKQYPSNRYRIVVGEVTHEVVPPEQKIELRPIKN